MITFHIKELAFGTRFAGRMGSEMWDKNGGLLKPEMVGIYARVSTLDKGRDVELQLSDLRAYATPQEDGRSRSMSI